MQAKPKNPETLESPDAPEKAAAKEDWEQRPQFKKRLAEYRLRTGKSVPDVAADLGCATWTLYGYLSKGIPGEAFKRRAAALFGVNPSEFLLVSQPAEIESVSVGPISAKRRLAVMGVVETLADPGLSDEQVLVISRALDQIALASKLSAHKD